MAPDTSERRPPLPLKDAALLKFQCYIDGRWCDADSGETFDIVNPATLVRIGTGPMMGAGETGARSRPRTGHGRHGAARPPRSARQSSANGPSFNSPMPTISR